MQRDSSAPRETPRSSSSIARLAWRALQPLVLAGAALASATATADDHDMSWSYFDGHYVYQEIDLIDVDDSIRTEDVHGSNFEGSLMFADNWMLRATYATSRTSFDSVVLHSEALSAGAAYRFAFNRNFNLVLGGGYAYSRAEGDAVVDGNQFRLRESSQGAYLDGRVRGRFAGRFELEGFVTGVYYEDDLFDEDVGYGLTGRFYITPLLAVSIGAFDSKEAEEPSLTLGIRLQGKGING